jgi:hypothetical protein
MFGFLKNCNLKAFKKEAEKRKSKRKRKKEIMKYLMGRGPVWPPVHTGCAAPAPRAANVRHKGAPGLVATLVGDSYVSDHIACRF